ncbi:hypothetical protein TRAPUB_1735 [Trametes pubescens]|uniref:Uncharacterized protein n=1 Tax=Trametes pubescens TaxID=154538 RepID=A0A1M2VIK5_TRAPU|nr:hypothetical protein TRAPUB_1735 [Trametes pubescens]
MKTSRAGGWFEHRDHAGASGAGEQMNGCALAHGLAGRFRLDEPFSYPRWSGGGYGRALERSDEFCEADSDTRALLREAA